MSGGGEKMSESFQEKGEDAMALGAAIAALGLLDGPIPDGEVVGGALAIAGAACYGVGRVLEEIGY